MKTIVAGSRGIIDEAEIYRLLDGMNANGEITEVVSGHCPSSPDIVAEKWARSRNIPVKIFLAEWKKFGKAAGPIRNGGMAEYADALIAFWDGKSNGTGDMIEKMNRLRKIVAIHYPKGHTRSDPVIGRRV
jgi:YspA, cpYpsA-related SLOG family